MDKLHWAYGFLLGIAATLLGIYFFVEVFTKYHFSEGVAILKYGGVLGKLITLGALLNLGLFFLLLQFRKDTMAKGVIVALVLLAILTFFV